jgi:hypothetical protein
MVSYRPSPLTSGRRCGEGDVSATLARSGVVQMDVKRLCRRLSARRRRCQVRSPDDVVPPRVARRRAVAVATVVAAAAAAAAAAPRAIASAAVE